MVAGDAGGFFDDEGESRGARLDDEAADGVGEVAADLLRDEVVGHGTDEHDGGGHGGVGGEDGGRGRHFSWRKHGGRSELSKSWLANGFPRLMPIITSVGIYVEFQCVF